MALLSKGSGRGISLAAMAAQAGKPEAQALLGDMYRWGHGCVQDYDEARCWFSASGQAPRGAGPRFGLATSIIRASAFHAILRSRLIGISKAADHGDVRGVVALASPLPKGHGLPQDPEEAGRLFLEAAERGDVRGHYNAALMYLERPRACQKIST